MFRVPLKYSFTSLLSNSVLSHPVQLKVSFFFFFQLDYGFFINFVCFLMFLSLNAESHSD